MKRASPSLSDWPVWAKVSEEVDEKLKTQKEAGAPLRLAHADWASGSIPWLVLIVGPEKIRTVLFEKAKTKFDTALMEFEK